MLQARAAAPDGRALLRASLLIQYEAVVKEATGCSISVVLPPPDPGAPFIRAAFLPSSGCSGAADARCSLGAHGRTRSPAAFLPRGRVAQLCAYQPS